MAINKTKCKKIAWIIFEHILLSRIFVMIAIMPYVADLVVNMTFIAIYLYNFFVEIILRIILYKNKKKRILIIFYKIASHCFVFLIIVLWHFHVLPDKFLELYLFKHVIYLIICLPTMVFFTITVIASEYFCDE